MSMALTITMTLAYATTAWAQYQSTTWGEQQTSTVEAESYTRIIDTTEASSGQADTSELLRDEPSIRIRQRGGLNGPAYLSVRGAEPESSRLLLDGIPLHGSTQLAVNVNLLLPELIGQIELFRTTAPVDMGRPAPGGILNLKLSDDTSSPYRIHLGGGSWFNRKFSGTFYQSLDNGNVWFSTSYRGTKGNFRFYDTNGTNFQRNDDNANARRLNNDFNQGSLLLIREWQHKKHRLRFISLTNGREGGVTGIDVAQATEARNSRVEQLFAVQGSRPRLLGASGDATWSLSLLSQQLAFQDPESEIGFGAQQRADQILMPHGAFHATWWLPKNIKLQATAELQFEYYRPIDYQDPVDIRFAYRVSPGIAAGFSWHTNNNLLEVHGSIRGDFQWQSNASTDVPTAPQASVFNSFTSPQAGLVIRPLRNEPTELQLFGYASRSHRQPGFFELFGDNGASVGNPKLRAESQTAVEGGLKFRHKAPKVAVSFASSIWKHWKQDAIVYLSLPQGVRKPFNIGGARLHGIDSSLQLQSRYINASTHLAWLHSTRNSEDPAVDGNALPWRAPWSVETDITAKYRGFFIGWEFHYDSRFYADERELRPYPARLEHELSAGWNSSDSAAPSVRMTIRNVGNRRVADIPFRTGGEDIVVPRPVSDFSGYPRPGRGYFLTLTWQRQGPS